MAGGEAAEKTHGCIFKKRGFQTVAIYGMHYIGERLYKELENTQIEVLYVMEQNKDGSNCPLKVY